MVSSLMLGCLLNSSTTVCDPVMGDSGPGMYVPEDLLPFYRDHLIRLADVLTPNQFEAELLTGMKITSVNEALIALDLLHGKGIRTVIMTSSELGSDDSILSFASQLMPDGSKERLQMKIPRLPIAFVGTGDLLAALLMAWLHRTNNNLSASCEKAMSTMCQVLEITYHYAKNSRGGLTPQNIELKLIQSKGHIENPVESIKAEKM